MSDPRVWHESADMWGTLTVGVCELCEGTSTWGPFIDEYSAQDWLKEHARDKHTSRSGVVPTVWSERELLCLEGCGRRWALADKRCRACYERARYRARKAIAA